MKLRYQLLLFLGVILASCGKSSVQPQAQISIKGVVINGTEYPTDTIGTQVWIAINYAGPGGYHLVYPNYSYDGYFYTQSQANALTLPAGWRVPSIADFNKMLSNFAGPADIDAYGDYYIQNPVMLIGTKHWDDDNGNVQHQGTNTSGFNIVQTPYVIIQNGNPVGQDSQFSYFVTSNTVVTDGIVQYSFQFDPDFEFIGLNNDPLTRAFNLRLVKDL
ncbi:FISUMP domain-containing protein [Mucilaginibacter sp.]|jgi:uncharacterized protein (TIGR02145 family)|uniref:FISUMP domain-containing protein n=1 Tax=Mucilaginibacter sp. TaxID=1882438 RepID=UPI002B829031|nr:FISUMP domain-containing protein [Mucilaginibacter sp.]HTI60825.1 FISUMP domain-containing protein [Mucilaginibacter sp.]